MYSLGVDSGVDVRMKVKVKVKVCRTDEALGSGRLSILDTEVLCPFFGYLAAIATPY